MTPSAVLATLLILAVGASSAFNKTISAASTIKAAVAYIQTHNITIWKLYNTQTPYWKHLLLLHGLISILLNGNVLGANNDFWQLEWWCLCKSLDLLTLHPTTHWVLLLHVFQLFNWWPKIQIQQISNCSVKVKVFKKYTATGTPDVSSK